MKYLNKRGGRVVFIDIKSADLQGEMTAVDAMTKALELEKEVNAVSCGFPRLIDDDDKHLLKLLEPFGSSWHRGS